MTEKKCKNCKYFIFLLYLKNRQYGRCEKIVDDDSAYHSDGLAELSDPSSLLVTEEFGCLLFEEKQ